jgi:hypothetical protein
VTGARTVLLANVQGPWIHPDTLDAERLVGIALDGLLARSITT